MCLYNITPKTMSSHVSSVDDSAKWRWAFIAVIVVTVVMLPMTYKLVDGLVSGLTGLRVASAGGVPTLLGQVLHIAVATAVLRGVMELKL